MVVMSGELCLFVWLGWDDMGRMLVSEPFSFLPSLSFGVVVGIVVGLRCVDCWFHYEGNSLFSPSTLVALYSISYRKTPMVCLLVLADGEPLQR
jgi:hypothetical protein